MPWIIRRWINHRRKRSQKGKTICVFHLMKRMDDDHGMKETSCDLNNPRITPSSKNCILVQFEARPERRLQFSNTVTCNRPLQHAACGLHWDSGVHEDEGGALSKGKRDQDCHVLYLKRIRTVVNKINKKTQEHLATTQANRRAPGKLGAATLTTEFLAHSFLLSNSRTPIAKTVKRLIQQFESHPNKESFWQDLKQTKENNEFSDKSKKLIADMKNTEIFELLEASSKKQCNFKLGDRRCFLLVEDV